MRPFSTRGTAHVTRMDVDDRTVNDTGSSPTGAVHKSNKRVESRCYKLGEPEGVGFKAKPWAPETEGTRNMTLLRTYSTPRSLSSPEFHVQPPELQAVSTNE